MNSTARRFLLPAIFLLPFLLTACRQVERSDSEPATVPDSSVEPAGPFGTLVVKHAGRLLGLDLDRDHEAVLWDLQSEIVGRITVSPDGSRIAYVQHKADVGPASLILRDRDAESVSARLIHREDTGESIGAMFWEPDGQSLVYALSHFSQVEDTRPSPVAWELRRVELGAKPVASLSSEQLWYQRTMLLLDPHLYLAAWDAASRRALVLGGPGENGEVDMVWLIDVADGSLRMGMPTAGEAYAHAASRDGRYVALGHHEDYRYTRTHAVRVVDLTRGRHRDVAEPEAFASGFLWPADERYLVWTEFQGWDGTGAFASPSLWSARLSKDAVPVARRLHALDAAWPLAAHPTRPLVLLSDGGLLDIETGGLDWPSATTGGTGSGERPLEVIAWLEH